MAKAADSANVHNKAPKPAKTGKPGRAAKPDAPNFFGRVVQYLRDVRSEMKRVVWPERPEVINSSIVVIVTLLFFAAFTFVVDAIVVQLLQLFARLG
jgi:preprotein translocase subunit SecE